MIVTRKQACEFITESMNNDIPLTGEKLDAVVLAANSDLTVRDWLMGAPNRWSLEESIELMQYICTQAPTEDIVPFITIQAAHVYESGDPEKAMALLKYALKLNKDYPLGNLLLRVFDVGWPAGSFEQMRKELDEEVVEKCFGEEGSYVITEEGEVYDIV